MVTNSDFNFTNNEAVTLELPFSEHIEELTTTLISISLDNFIFNLCSFY